MERRFQPICVEQPDETAAVNILTGLRPRLEEHHRAVITDEAIKAAVKLSERYLNDRRLPDKAIDLIDEAAARARTERLSVKQKLFGSVSKRERVIVGAEDVAKAVSAITGIPAARLSENESERLSNLESLLRRRVIGQEKAVSLVANAVRRGRAGLKDPERPIGSSDRRASVRPSFPERSRRAFSATRGGSYGSICPSLWSVIRSAS